MGFVQFLLGEDLCRRIITDGFRQRVRFFDDARGSATECAACLDAIVTKKACKQERVFEGKDMLLSVVSILSALISRFEGASTKTPVRAGSPLRRTTVRRSFREEETE